MKPREKKTLLEDNTWFVYAVLKSSLASITCGNDDFSGRFVLVKCEQTSVALQIVEAMKKDHWKVVIGSHFLHYFHRGILSLGNVLNNSVAEVQQNLITCRLCTRLLLLLVVTKI